MSKQINILQQILCINTIDLNVTDHNGNRALMVAIITRQIEMIQLLIDVNFDLELMNKSDENAIKIKLAIDTSIVKGIHLL